jgi:hypothetical protein
VTPVPVTSQPTVHTDSLNHQDGFILLEGGCVLNDAPIPVYTLDSLKEPLSASTIADIIDLAATIHLDGNAVVLDGVLARAYATLIAAFGGAAAQSPAASRSTEAVSEVAYLLSATGDYESDYYEPVRNDLTSCIANGRLIK